MTDLAEHTVTVTAGRFHDPFLALGRAVNFLRNVEPFASYPFGAFAATVAGQIERGHYLVVMHGEAVVGYFGYALCEEAVARAWMEGRHVPTLDECRRGDVVVGMTMHAVSREVLVFLVREARKILPAARIVFRRRYANGKPERLTSAMNRRRSAA